MAGRHAALAHDAGTGGEFQGVVGSLDDHGFLRGEAQNRRLIVAYHLRSRVDPPRVLSDSQRGWPCGHGERMCPVKRNKPLVRHRKLGTQWRRRKQYRHDHRSAREWMLWVPQSFVGARETVLDMHGAVPDGDLTDLPEDPQMRDGSLRWRLHRGGKTVYVYGHPTWGRGGPGRTDRDSSSEDIHYIFTARRRACTRGSKCPLTSYFLSWYSDIEILEHRPDRCPMTVLDEGPPWRRRSQRP